DSIPQGGMLQAHVQVSNAGDRAGEEVVQLYVRDLVGSVTRPVKELKGFQKIYLEPGASKRVTFEITEEDLKFYNAELEYTAEPGEFAVFVGGNSRDVQEKHFVLVP